MLINVEFGLLLGFFIDFHIQPVNFLVRI